MHLETWVNMQHKNVHPITRHNKISTVMKALHSVREDKSQLFEWKVRRDTTACIAQLNTKKQKGHPFSKKRKFVLSIGLFLVTKILLDRIVKPPLSDRKITLCMSCLETYSMYIQWYNLLSVGVLYKESKNPEMVRIPTVVVSRFHYWRNKLPEVLRLGATLGLPVMLGGREPGCGAVAARWGLCAAGPRQGGPAGAAVCYLFLRLCSRL